MAASISTPTMMSVHVVLILMLSLVNIVSSTPIPTSSPTPSPTIRASNFTWKSDDITTQIVNQSNHALFTLSSSHLVLPAEHSEWGHYALKVGNESTPCLDWHSSEEKVMEALQALPSIFNRGGLSVVSKVIDYGYSHEISMNQKNESSWLLDALSIERQSLNGNIDMSIASAYLSNNHYKNSFLDQQYENNMVSCDIVRTYGEWDDSTQWEEGAVPGAEYKLSASTSKPYVPKEFITKANDYVMIPPESGFIQLSHSIAIGGMDLKGGNIITMESSCPSGWSKPADANNGNRHINERVGIHAGNNVEYTSNPKQTKQFGYNDHQTKCFAAFYGPSQKNVNRGGVNELFEEKHKFGNEFQSPNNRDWTQAGFLHGEVDDKKGLNWYEAEKTCQSFNGHLANIESYYENEVVKGLCQGLAYEKLEKGPGDEVFRSGLEQADEDLVGKDRNKYEMKAKHANKNGESRDMDGVDPKIASKLLGDDGSLFHSQARDPRCWIGLRDENLDGNWLWTDEKGMTSTTWRSWSRNQPDNRTSELTGESCALMSSSLYHVERQHLGTWEDERCESPFAFVCERPALSKGYTLTIGGGGLLWRGGVISGGGLVRNLGSTLITPETSTRDEGTGDFGYYGTVNTITDNAWREGEAWLQGINELGLIDAGRLELFGATLIEENTIITAGDGTVFTIIDEFLDENSFLDQGEFATNQFNQQTTTPVSSHWPSNVDWIYDDGYTKVKQYGVGGGFITGGHGYQFNEVLHNEKARTALYIRSNVTLRTIKGNGPLWAAPPLPQLPIGGEASTDLAYYNKAYHRMTKSSTSSSSSRNGQSSEVSMSSYNKLYQSNVKTNKVSTRLQESLFSTPASSHDSFIRGVYVTGSIRSKTGNVRVSSPVTGSGRRPRLINQAQVWFVGEQGDSSIEWFYEAGDGRGGGFNVGRNSNGTMYNATGVLIANSTLNRLSLAGGGLATGGSSISLSGGGIKLDNFSLVLSSSPTFTLSVTSERPVLHEERAWGVIYDELSNQADSNKKKRNAYPDPTDATPANEERSYGVNGTYRIAVRHPYSGEVYETECLPYHSTAHRVEYSLSKLQSVVELGGVTVRRDGDPTSPRWGFGYRYNIIFDQSNEINPFGMNAGNRYYLKSTTGGGGGGSTSSSSSSSAYEPWAWDLESGIMSDGRRENDYRNGDDLYASYRNSTDQFISENTQVYISCQGAQQPCGCSDLLTFLDTNDDEMNSYNQNIKNDYNEKEYISNLNDLKLNTKNDKLKEITLETSSSDLVKSRVVKDFGYRGFTCRRHESTSVEHSNGCIIQPRFTLSLLHGGGECFIHDGNLTSLVETNADGDDDDGVKKTTMLIASSYQNSMARHVSSSMISISSGFHRLPSLFAGGSGLEIIGGTAYVLASNFTISFVYIGTNQTQQRDNHDNIADFETFLSDGQVNGTGGVGKLGGGLGGQGLLICGGAGFVGMDNAFLLYEGPSTQSRQYLRHVQ